MGRAVLGTWPRRRGCSCGMPAFAATTHDAPTSLVRALSRPRVACVRAGAGSPLADASPRPRSVPGSARLVVPDGGRRDDPGAEGIRAAARRGAFQGAGGVARGPSDPARRRLRRPGRLRTPGRAPTHPGPRDRRGVRVGAVPAAGDGRWGRPTGCVVDPAGGRWTSRGLALRVRQPGGVRSARRCGDAARQRGPLGHARAAGARPAAPDPLHGRRSHGVSRVARAEPVHRRTGGHGRSGAAGGLAGQGPRGDRRHGRAAAGAPGPGGPHAGGARTGTRPGARAVPRQLARGVRRRAAVPR